MQKLREKYANVTDPVKQHEYNHKLSHLIGRPHDPNVLLHILMQDEIDQ
jgi:hypothetical protein